MSFLFSRRRTRLRTVLALGDALLVIASLVLSYQVVGSFAAKPLPAAEVARKLALAGWVFVAVQVGVLYILGLYELKKSSLDWRSVGHLFFAVGTAAVLTSGVLFFLPRFLIGRQILLFQVPLLGIGLFAWRYIWLRFAVGEEPPRRLGIAGDRAAVFEFIREVSGDDFRDYTISRVYVSPPGAISEDEVDPSLSGIEWSQSLERFLAAEDYDALAVSLREFGDDEKLTHQLLARSFAGVPIHDLATLQKDLTGRFSASGVRGSSILEAVATRVAPNRYYWRAKRLADVMLAGPALLLCAIPMLLVAALIKLESRGPVFFVQERLGIRREPFSCIKFRTMAVDAEDQSGPVWAGEEDPRITRVGRLLRKTRIDELPQLVSVVRGDMTLVGPRPIRAFFADQLAAEIPFYDLRFAVKPGLTGWAQAHQTYVRSQEDQEIKFRYELFYLENFSLWLDLYTLVKTLRVVVARRGG